MLLHLGFALFLSIGTFPWVSLSGLCALLPALFWDKLSPHLPNLKSRQNIRIFYDKDCGFCFKMALIFRELSALPHAAVTPAQDDATAGPLLESTNSWVLHSHKQQYLTHWDAVSYTWRRSPILFPLGFLFMLPIFKQIGHGIYLLIAKYRKQLANLSAQFLPFHERPIYTPNYLTDYVLTMLVIAVFALNLHNTKILNVAWPKWMDNTLHVVALKQRWGMYAPYPVNTSNWIVVEGKRHNDGATIDVMNQEPSPPSHAKPANGWELFPDFRWRKYFSRIKWDTQGERVASYYCRNWAETHPDMPIESVEIFSYRQRTALPNTPSHPITGGSIYKAKC